MEFSVTLTASHTLTLPMKTPEDFPASPSLSYQDFTEKFRATIQPRRQSASIRRTSATLCGRQGERAQPAADL